MDLDDSLSLSLYELEKGVATITMTEEWFDCYPAIQTAFKFTKLMLDTDKDLEHDEDDVAKTEADEEKTEAVLLFSEFQLFLAALKQYYMYCKVALISNTMCTVR